MDGGLGHHEVHYEATTDRYWVTSDEEIDFSPENQGEGLSVLLEASKGDNNLLEAMSAFNRIFVEGQESGFALEGFDDSSISGISLMATVREPI